MSVRYGMISVASITDRFMHAVLENGDVITAVASRSLTKAKQKADQYGIKRAYSSYEDVYRDNDVDIVYIAVNNANHSREVKERSSMESMFCVKSPSHFVLRMQRSCSPMRENRACF